jgi:hypothetical protein
MNIKVKVLKDIHTFNYYQDNLELDLKELV